MQRSWVPLARGCALFLAFITIGYFAPALAQKAYRTAFPAPAFEVGDYSRWQGEAASPVVLFTTTTCPWCRRARALLDRQHVAYRDYAIDTGSEAERLYAELDERGVPVLLIGDRKIVGYREQAIVDAVAKLRGID